MKALRLQLNYFANLLLKSQVSKSIRITGTAVLITSMIGFLTTPIISRIFSPEAYGIAGLYFSSLAVLYPISSWSFPSAIVVTKNDFRLYKLLGALKVVVVLSSLICLLVVAIFKTTIQDLLGDTSSGTWLWLLPLGLIFGNLASTISSLNIRAGQFKKNATAQVMMATVAKPLSIAAGWLSQGYYLILVVFDMLAVIPAIMLQRKKHILAFVKMRTDLQGFKNAIVQFKNYPLFILPAEFLSNLSLRSPFLIISGIYTIDKAGAFLFASTILQIPLTVAWNALNPVFIRQGTLLYASDKQKLAKLCRYTNNTLFFTGLIPVAILTIFGQEIFIFIFGKAWTEAGIVCEYLAVYYLFRLATSPLTAIYRIANKEEQSLINQVILFVFRVVPLLAGLYFFNFEFAVAFFSIGSLAGYIFGFWQVGKIIEFSIWRTFLLQCLIFIATVVVLYGIKIYLF